MSDCRLLQSLRVSDSLVVPNTAGRELLGQGQWQVVSSSQAGVQECQQHTTQTGRNRRFPSVWKLSMEEEPLLPGTVNSRC